MQSVLTHRAICDAIFENPQLEYIHVDYLMGKIKPSGNQLLSGIDLDLACEAFKSIFHELWLEQKQQFPQRELVSN